MLYFIVLNRAIGVTRMLYFIVLNRAIGVAQLTNEAVQAVAAHCPGLTSIDVSSCRKADRRGGEGRGSSSAGVTRAPHGWLPSQKALPVLGCEQRASYCVTAKHLRASDLHLGCAA